jgi:hypothetical protein
MLRQGCFASGGLRSQAFPGQRQAHSSCNRLNFVPTYACLRRSRAHASNGLQCAAAVAAAPSAAPAVLQWRQLNAGKQQLPTPLRRVAAHASKEATGGLAAAVSAALAQHHMVHCTCVYA